METLAHQLHDLAEQVQKTEHIATASWERDRAALEAHRDELRESWADEVTRTRQSIDADDVAVHFRWSQMRERVKGQFAELQDRSERRRTDHDVLKAERRADQAERDAAEAVDFAVLVVHGATAAIVDAMVARADADDLTTSAALDAGPSPDGDRRPG